MDNGFQNVVLNGEETEVPTGLIENVGIFFIVLYEIKHGWCLKMSDFLDDFLWLTGIPGDF